MLEDQEHSTHILRDICEFTGILYHPQHDIFEEYHAGLLPFQEMNAVLREKLKSPHNSAELQRSETYREYLGKFKIAAELAVLDEDDRAIVS